MPQLITILISDMKYFLLSLFVFIGIISCQKEITDEVDSFPFDTTVVVKDTGKLEADIDSVHWVASLATKATYEDRDSLGNPPLLTISAASSDGSTLTIAVIDSIVRTKVYDIYAIDSGYLNIAEYDDSTSASKGTFYSNDSIFTPGIKVGTVSITAFDTTNKTISGTFSLKLGRSKDSSYRNFANGKFTKIQYTKSTNIVSTSGPDSFYVKINDTLFSPDFVEVQFISSRIAVAAYNSARTKSMTIYISDTTKTGNFTFGAIPSVTYLSNITSGYAPNINTGNLEVLEYNPPNKRLRANFSFIGKNITNSSDSLRFTQGYFSVETP